MFPIVVRLEPLLCPNSHTMSVASRTLIEVLFHLFANFLWRQLDRLNGLATVTTIERYLSAFRIELGFAFFSKCRNIGEVRV